jgi:BMFP domain-containing protein YqiC
MLDPKHLDDLARRLSGSLPEGLQALQEDINRNLRASLEGGLAKLDLVTREEFDVQVAVLARTREKLEKLEALLAELEQQPDSGGARAKRPARRKTTKRPN